MKRITSSDELKVGDKVYIEHTVTGISNTDKYPLTLTGKYSTEVYTKDLKYRNDASPETIYVGNPEESLPQERLVRVWDNEQEPKDAHARKYIGETHDGIHVARSLVGNRYLCTWDNMMEIEQWDKIYAPKPIEIEAIEMVSVPRDIVECLSEQSIILKKYL